MFIYIILCLRRYFHSINIPGKCTIYKLCYTLAMAFNIIKSKFSWIKFFKDERKNVEILLKYLHFVFEILERQYFLYKNILFFLFFITQALKIRMHGYVIDLTKSWYLYIKWMVYFKLYVYRRASYVYLANIFQNKLTKWQDWTIKYKRKILPPQQNAGFAEFFAGFGRICRILQDLQQLQDLQDCGRPDMDLKIFFCTDRLRKGA